MPDLVNTPEDHFRLKNLETRVDALEIRVDALERQAHATFGMLASICAQVEARVKTVEIQQFQPAPTPPKPRAWNPFRQHAKC